MDEFLRQTTSYMQSMGVPQQYYPMAAMPQEDLESMYPDVYNMVYPGVKMQCDQMHAAYGPMYTLTRDQLNDMVENVCANVENMPLAGMEEDEKDENERQPFFYGGRRRFLRDLVTILFIRELIGRRRPYYGYGYGFGYPAYYGGYPGYYGGY